MNGGMCMVEYRESQSGILYMGGNVLFETPRMGDIQLSFIL